MELLERVSIKARLFGTFGLLLGSLLLLIALGYRNNASTQQGVEAMLSNDFAKYELAAAIDSATKGNARNTMELFLFEPEQQEVVRKRMAGVKKDIDEMFQRLEPLLSTEDEKALF